MKGNIAHQLEIIKLRAEKTAFVVFAQLLLLAALHKICKVITVLQVLEKLAKLSKITDSLVNAKSRNVTANKNANSITNYMQFAA